MTQSSDRSQRTEKWNGVLCPMIARFMYDVRDRVVLRVERRRRPVPVQEPDVRRRARQVQEERHAPDRGGVADERERLGLVEVVRPRARGAAPEAALVREVGLLTSKK